MYFEAPLSAFLALYHLHLQSCKLEDMEASEARKLRLPCLLSRVFSRSPKEGVDTSISLVTVETTSRPRCLVSDMPSCTSQLPVHRGSHVLRPPAAEHGQACFPLIFKHRIPKLFRSNVSNGISPSAASKKARPFTSKRVKPRLHRPFSPLSRKPGSSSSSFYISSPICTTSIKERHPQVLDVRSSKVKQLPRLPSRFSEYTFVSEFGNRAVAVEPSNASSELLHVSSDCLVTEANKHPPELSKEVTLTVPSKRRLRKIPPALPTEDWELVEIGRVCPRHALENEADKVLPTVIQSDASEEKSASLSDVLSGHEQEVTRASAITVMSPNSKVLAFGTNPVLPDDIVQAFIRTRVFPRRAGHPSRTKASSAMVPEEPVRPSEKFINVSTDEDEDMSDQQRVATGGVSPLATPDAYRSEDTPTSATTPALSSADTASIYSCSSAAYTTNDDITVAVSSPNESDLDGKCFEAIINEAKDQIAALEAARPSPRQLVARSFPSGLSISIPLKSPLFRNAKVNDTIHNESLLMPAVREVSNITTMQLLHSDILVEHPDSLSLNPSGLDDTSLSSVKTVSKGRQSRRHGTLYGKLESKVTFLPRHDDNSSSLIEPKSEPLASVLALREGAKPHASILYRGGPRPGLRPLLLPRLLPQYHDQRNSLNAPSSGSLPPPTPIDDSAATFPTCSEQSPVHMILGTSECEWSPVSTSSPIECGRDGLALLRPEHIKLRRSKSSARLLLAPGPAF